MRIHQSASFWRYVTRELLPGQQKLENAKWWECKKYLPERRRAFAYVQAMILILDMVREGIKGQVIGQDGQ